MALGVSGCRSQWGREKGLIAFLKSLAMTSISPSVDRSTFPEQIVGDALGRIRSPSQREHSETVTMPQARAPAPARGPGDSGSLRRREAGPAEAAAPQLPMPSVPAGLFLRLPAGCVVAPLTDPAADRVPGAP